MKKILLAIAVFAGIIAASCQKETDQGVYKSEQNSLQFTASIEEGAVTKTTVERIAGTTATYKTKWEITDKISINGTVYTASPKTDSTQANFTKESGNDPTATFKAYYPSAMFNGTTATLPATYTYEDGKYNMPMYAQSNTTALEFKNLCGILAITVPRAQITSVCSITVLSDKQMNGAFTATSEGVLTFESKTLTAADKKVALTFSEAKTIKSDSSVTFYIPVPAGTHNPLTINVSSDSRMKTMVTKKSGGVTVARNKVYPITFADNQPDMLPGLFSVSATKKVRFSKGNLQYQTSTNTWRFATNQYDAIADAAGNNVSSGRATQNAWIDLFGWGATGQNSYGQQPYSSSQTDSDYKTVATAASDETLTIANKADWGYCMGGEASVWRTLTKDEWTYLITTRGTDSTHFRMHVHVCGKDNCLVIAPDGNTMEIAESYSAYTWPTLEAYGFVCLPAAGRREGSEVNTVGIFGHYWSSTAFNENSAYFMCYIDHTSYYSHSVVSVQNDVRSAGFSVRLVSDAQ